MNALFSCVAYCGVPAAGDNRGMRLTEQTAIAPRRVDREAGLIEGVRILGPDSRNGRRYSIKAMNEAARLYEGAPVNVDHPANDRKDRPLAEAFGWIRNVRTEPDGVYGDLHYLRSHPQAEMVAEAAERNPHRIGLSHHAEGTVRMDGQRVIVETVERVYSVDLVQTPATNAGLFESEGKRMTIREAAMAAGEEKVMAAEGMDAYAEKPMRENESDYFGAMVSEVMAMDADRSEKMKRLAAILKAQEMLTASNGATPEAPEMEEGEGMADELKKAVAEAVAPIMTKFDKLLESFAEVKADSDARKLLESSGREVTPERVAALLAVEAGQRSKLVESWPVSQRGSRPTSSPPASKVADYPTDSRQFLAAIRSN
jgi:hypothetical protein